MAKNTVLKMNGNFFNNPGSSGINLCVSSNNIETLSIYNHIDSLDDTFHWTED